MSRIKIPVSFAYVSGSSLDPVVGTSVSIISRTTQLPATVYQAESESNPSTISPVTDAEGNVPGWVEPGSYTATASAQGSFAGASVAFEAVRGDGVTNVAAGAVDIAQLAADILNALVPTGTILDFAGQTCPSGFVFGDASVYPIGTVGSTYYNLSQICGTKWNTGGEGTGNFRVPDLRGVTLRGAGQNAMLSTSTYQLAGSGGAENVALTVDQLPSHAHSITDGGHIHTPSDPGHAHGVYDPGHLHGFGGVYAPASNYAFSWIYPGSIGGSGSYRVPTSATTSSWAISQTAGAGTGIGIYSSGTGISIQKNITSIVVNANGSGYTHPNMSPFVVTNRIIKL